MAMWKFAKIKNDSMNRFFKILPWLVIIIAVGAAYSFHSANKAKEVELTTLRSQAAEISELQKENVELRKLPSHSDEIVQLKKENADLLKLRNETRKSREEKKQLSSRVQSVVAKAKQADAAIQAHVVRATQQQAQLQVGGQNLLGSGQPQDSRVTQMNACINNLRQIDGAKQQWALENKKSAQALPAPDDIGPYIKNGVPKCPANGVYAINAVDADPTCSIPGHQLPQ
jgi:hypothetical protein